MSNNESNTSANENQVASLCSSLQVSLMNMSAAIKCSICQCSYTDPVQLPCVHIYCRDCIQHLLPSNCPICKAPATRRSVTDCEAMEQTVRAVKTLLRVFGLSPVVYDSSVTAMTQQVNDDDDAVAAVSVEDIRELVNVSRIQHYFMQDKSTSQQQHHHHAALEMTNSWKQQQATIVEANVKALQEAQSSTHMQSQESFYSTQQDSNLTTTEEFHSLSSAQHNETTTTNEAAAGAFDFNADSLTLPTRTPRVHNNNTRSHPIEPAAAAINVVTNYKSESPAQPREQSPLLALDSEEIFARKRRSSAADPRRLEATMNDSPQGRSEMANNADDTAGEQFTGDEMFSHAPSSHPELDSANALQHESAAKALALLAETETDAASLTHVAANGIETTTSDNHNSSMSHVDEQIEGEYRHESDANDIPAMGQQTYDDIEAEEEEEPKETMAGGFQPVQSDDVISNPPGDEPDTINEGATDHFAVGQVVNVQARTWPGINKSGGVGRITKVRYENHAVSYDVAFVLGGRETRVDAVFVSLHDAGAGSITRETKAEACASNVSTSASAKEINRRASRRIAECIIPPSLLRGLEAEGYDVGNGALKGQTHRISQGKKRKATIALSPDRQSRASMANYSITGIDQTDQGLVFVKDVCLMADQWYRERFEAALAKKTINVVCSSLTEHDRMQLESLRSHSKDWNARIKLCDSFHSQKTTLLILPPEQKPPTTNGDLVGMTRRCKSMQAAVSGVQLITPLWISDCLFNERIDLPSPERIVRSLPMTSGEGSFGVARLAAAKRQDKDNLLLNNVDTFLCSSFDSKLNRDIHTILHAAGSGVLSNIAAVKKSLTLGKRIVCLCNNKTKISQALEDALLARPGQVLVVDCKWLFDCISSGTVLGKDGYQPKDAKAKQLWQSTMY